LLAGWTPLCRSPIHRAKRRLVLRGAQAAEQLNVYKGQLMGHLSFMESLLRATIHQKIVDSQALPLPRLTRRDIWLPTVKGKATAIIGMRRAGKTSLLWQVLADRHAHGISREGLLDISFEDERLADLLVEIFYQLCRVGFASSQ